MRKSVLFFSTVQYSSLSPIANLVSDAIPPRACISPAEYVSPVADLI